MKILIFTTVCFAAVVLPSCVDPNYYPTPSNNFKPNGELGNRLRGQEGRLAQEQNRSSGYKETNAYKQSDAYKQSNAYQQENNYEKPADQIPRRDEYPPATRTQNRDQVLSPYKPFNVIDVEGFRSGQLAKDPSNGKIFRIP